MKKLIYLFFGLALSFSSIQAAQAQTFLLNNGALDTVSDFVRAPNPDVTVYNGIKSASAQQPVTIKWTVLSASVPSGVVLNFCDNITCYTPAAVVPGSIHVSSNYNNSNFGDFHALFANMGNAPANSKAYITVKLEDTVGHYTRNVTFRADKGALGVVTTSLSADNITLYPNPARDAVNVIYNAGAGVRNIAIYNLIGKVVKVFRPLDDNSARLDIDNIPTGVYFVRLMDAQGHVLATRRFTRQ